jgi:hypothetical protein
MKKDFLKKQSKVNTRKLNKNQMAFMTLLTFSSSSVSIWVKNDNNAICH